MESITLWRSHPGTIDSHTNHLLAICIVSSPAPRSTTRDPSLGIPGRAQKEGYVVVPADSRTQIAARTTRVGSSFCSLHFQKMSLGGSGKLIPSPRAQVCWLFSSRLAEQHAARDRGATEGDHLENKLAFYLIGGWDAAAESSNNGKAERDRRGPLQLSADSLATNVSVKWVTTTPTSVDSAS